MKTMETEIAQALSALKAEHRSNWTAFNSKLNAILPQVGARNSEENIAEYIAAEDFIAIGFTPTEADALMFVFTEDCMGQAVINLELVERWFCYCA
jgi:hypothetical protein